MLFVPGEKSTCPVGSNSNLLQYNCIALFGGDGACEIVLLTGSYSKKIMGLPQLLGTNLAPAKSTLPFGSKDAGQSLQTIVSPFTLGMSGPIVQVPFSVGFAGGAYMT